MRTWADAKTRLPQANTIHSIHPASLGDQDNWEDDLEIDFDIEIETTTAEDAEAAAVNDNDDHILYGSDDNMEVNDEEPVEKPRVKDFPLKDWICSHDRTWSPYTSRKGVKCPWNRYSTGCME